jgi:hypothetical protein
MQMFFSGRSTPKKGAPTFFETPMTTQRHIAEEMNL